MMRLRLAAVVAGLAVAAALIGARTGMAAEAADKTERTVSVSATGSVSAEPDVAYVTTGVISEAATAREALSANSVLMSKIVTGLKTAGIPAKDIQTTSINVEPRYDSPKDRPASIKGYRVVNQVRITTRDIKRLGDVLDAAVGLGANEINGISFEVSNAEQLKDDARKAAMANALRRARLYATAAGADVGQVLSISEDVRTVGPAAPRVMGRSSLAAAPPVEGGSLRLDVEVHVTWALR